MNEKPPKHCVNCEYYVPHYFKFKAHFSRIKGRCINGEISAKTFDKKFDKSEPCEFWKSNEQQTALDKQNIVKALLNMAERIEQMAFILKDDDGFNP